MTTLSTKEKLTPMVETMVEGKVNEMFSVAHKVAATTSGDIDPHMAFFLDHVKKALCGVIVAQTLWNIDGHNDDEVREIYQKTISALQEYICTDPKTPNVERVLIEVRGGSIVNCVTTNDLIDLVVIDHDFDETTRLDTDWDKIVSRPEIDQIVEGLLTANASEEDEEELFTVDIPLSIDEWTQYDISEALTEGWIKQEEIDSDCDMILAHFHSHGIGTVWIQRIFDRVKREYTYYTLVETNSIMGAFEQCARLLKDKLS